MPELLTLSITDTAKSLSVGRSTIYEFINAGDLHAIKLGRRTLVTVSSIKALIANADIVGDVGHRQAA
jgi:hypothetical protein